MSTKAKDTQKGNFLDRLGGDKVVWIILLFLCMLSLVSIFSSTSQMATAENSRIDIVKSQLVTIIGGLVVVFCVCKVNKVKIFKYFSQYGFVLCFFLLAILNLKKPFLFITPSKVNNAWRILKIGGLQIHVYEIVKVTMVMYLAWAIDAFKKDEFKIVEKLASRHPRLSFLRSASAKKIIYIFAPTLIICVMVLPGGTSSALFIALVLFATMILGGVEFLDLLKIAGLGAAAIGICIGIYFISSASHEKNPEAKVAFGRLGTAFSRLNDSSISYEDVLEKEPKNSKEYRDARDKLLQPLGAKLAIKEGGILGKGPGNSTQKYIVPIIYEDYIFSFIIEEYGLLGGIFVIILYISLLARGSLIVKNCKNDFGKIAVAGLCAMITGQAIFHILINCDVGILTGQTLPMISHGTSSFLCFSLAFGIILSISRIAEKQLELETKNADPLMEYTGDDIQDTISEAEMVDDPDREITDNDIY